MKRPWQPLAADWPSVARHIPSTLHRRCWHWGHTASASSSVAEVRQILPAARTLRVRLISPLKERAKVIGQRLGLDSDKAQRRTQEIDKERTQFVEGCFHKNSTDPHNYDLVLDSTRFGVVGSAQVILEAFERLRESSGS